MVSVARCLRWTLVHWRDLGVVGTLGIAFQASFFRLRGFRIPLSMFVGFFWQVLVSPMPFAESAAVIARAVVVSASFCL